MADLGTRQSDERTKQVMQRLEETYTEAYKTAIQNEKKAIEKYASLTDEALKELTPEQRELKRTAFKNEIQRTKTLAKRIANEIANVGEMAATIIQGELTGIYGLNYDYSAFSIQKQVGLNLEFTIYDRNQLAVLVQKKQSPFTKIAYKNLGKDEVIVQRLQNQFIQGVMNGESQQKLIRRIRGVTEQSYRQARRVAQTERNRVQSQGRNQAIHEAAEIGLEMKKQWIARLRNTRDLHLKTHLEIVNEGDKFSNGLEFPGDPNGEAKNVVNCFCLIKPIVKSISPALAKRREEFKIKSFKQFVELTGNDIVMAKTDIDYYNKRIEANKASLEKAQKRQDTKAAEFHANALKSSKSKLKTAQTHLKQAQKNHEKAKERVKSGD